MNASEFDSWKDVVFHSRFHGTASWGAHIPHVMDLVAVWFSPPLFVVNVCPKDPWRDDLQGRKDISSSVFCGASRLFFMFIVKAF